MSIQPIVLLRKDLVQRGVTDPEIRKAVRLGTLVKLCRAGYAQASWLTAAQSPTQHRYEHERVHLIARIHAEAARRPGLVVSDRSAAILHNLPLDKVPEEVELTRLTETGARRDGIVRVRPFRLPDQAICEVDGLQVTSVAQTLVDLGRLCPGPAAVIAADAALHVGVTSGPELSEALFWSRCRTGISRARRSLVFADGRAGSPAESRSRFWMNHFGFPASELQVTILSPSGGFIAITDFLWPDLGLVGECDGRIKYTDMDVVYKEKWREDQIREVGLDVVRWSAEDSFKPDKMMSHLLAAAQRSSKSLAARSIVAELKTAQRMGI